MRQPQTTFCLFVCLAAARLDSPACVQSAWPPPQHCLGSQTPIHSSDLGRVLQIAQSLSRSVLRIPPPVELSDKAHKPRSGDGPPPPVLSGPFLGDEKSVWVEYAHNSLPFSATGLTPFQLPLFSNQEAKVVVPSASAYVQCYLLAWRKAFQGLLHSVQSYKKWADKCRTPAPLYLVGQRVCLYTTDLLFISSPTSRTHLPDCMLTFTGDSPACFIVFVYLIPT